MHQVAKTPSLIVMDYETELLDGRPSIDFYRPDFRVKSCAFTWYGGSLHLTGEESIGRYLRELSVLEVPLVVHNISFEYGVTTTRFPGVNLNWHSDTMRLTQVYDNGGNQDYDNLNQLLTPIKTGLSLQACADRVLPKEFHNHKEPFYLKIREQGIKKGQEGANLHLLTPEDYKDYNIADTKITYALYTTLTSKFSKWKYDWTFDHYLYMNSAKLISDSKIRGVKVDRTRLAESMYQLTKQIEQINLSFKTKFANEIFQIEKETFDSILGSYSTDKGKEKARSRIASDRSEIEFKVTSSKQMSRLFVDLLGMEPKYLTPTGKPSFSKHFLSQWGEGGTMLSKVGTKRLILNQCKALFKLSEYDGKWHIDLMAAGTTTGRMKGRQE